MSLISCSLCPEDDRFAVPAPLDPAGAAMMAEHLRTEHDERLRPGSP